MIARERPWVEKLVLADYRLERAVEVQRRLGDADRFPAEVLDASNQGMIEALARKYEVDLVMNAVDPLYNQQVFDAAFAGGSPLHGHGHDPVARRIRRSRIAKPGVKLGDYQFERAEAWEKKGLLALVGMGVEPGMADVFARYAQDHLFDEIDEIGIRDGANLEVDGYEFAPSFSIWTTIEECLNPPAIWEKDRGWFTTEPFSEAGSLRLSRGYWEGRSCQCGARGGAADSALGEDTARDIQVRTGGQVHLSSQDAAYAWPG